MMLKGLLRHKWLVIFALLSTLVYIVCYMLVVSNPRFFLTEFSSTTYQSSSSPLSNSTTVDIPLSQLVTAEAVHWGWLNYSHEKYVLSLAIFFVSFGLCSYFKRASTDVAETEIRQRPIRRRIGDAFAVYGFFIVLWSLSLMFVPFTAYDSVLTILFIFVAVFLLAVSGIYLLLKTRKEAGKRRIKIGNALTVFGIFLAVWFTISTFLGQLFFSLACVAFTLLVIGYFIAKALKIYMKKIEEEN